MICSNNGYKSIEVKFIKINIYTYYYTTNLKVYLNLYLKQFFLQRQ